MKKRKMSDEFQPLSVRHASEEAIMDIPDSADMIPKRTKEYGQ